MAHRFERGTRCAPDAPTREHLELAYLVEHDGIEPSTSAMPLVRIGTSRVPERHGRSPDALLACACKMPPAGPERHALTIRESGTGDAPGMVRSIPAWAVRTEQSGVGAPGGVRTRQGGSSCISL